MKDFMIFLKDMHICVCTLMLVPVVSILNKVPIAEVYNNWYYEYIVKKFL